MKKSWIIIGLVLVGMISCSKVRRSPGRAYMPDMAYSRAYETYASTEALKKRGINYTALPVHGTIARGEMLQTFNFPGDTTGYAMAVGFKNPVPSDSIDMTEAERLYLINCGICHGSKLDGQGPLYNDGKGPFPAMPKNLVSDDVKKLGDGQIFHVITFGKGQMGSYASQLNSYQRWMVIDYIRSKQGSGAAVATIDSTAGKAVKDTATVKTGK